jgi:hypothetical protein
MLDSHKYVKNLMDAGFTQEQAEAMANGQLQLLEAVATKQDIKTEIALLEVRQFKANVLIAGVLFAALTLVITFAAR